MLYPRQNAYRLRNDISGYWSFIPDPGRKGNDQRWFESGLPAEALTIAVPGAWNEQLAERGIMNFVGLGWYETSVSLPQASTEGQRVWLRVGGADHRADVWLNGRSVGSHEGGYLPFEIELTEHWKAGEPNRLVIAVDSALSMHTIPQDVDPLSPMYGKGYERRHTFPPTRFDFFPYGGLTRAVYIVTTPTEYITDAHISTHLDGTFSATMESHRGKKWSVAVVNDKGDVVAETSADKPGAVSLKISSPVPWSPARPYLYTARFRLLGDAGSVIDQYDLPFGFREIRVEGGQLLFNNIPLFLTGFGKHEDFPIVGRGNFRPGMVRDFELLRWIGANSFRTSHYPYDEEVMNLADEMGFLVIDEVPAVSLGFWTDRFEELTPLLENHKRTLLELIRRDRNHPSVISWSIVNEPNLWSEPFYQNGASRKYFRAIYDHVKQLDASRPVMAITIPAHSENDVALEACDVIGINRYYAWYTEPGEIAKAKWMLSEELDRIYSKHGKPIVVTEFGVDAVEGYHSTTPQFFTEEYQVEFLKAYCDIFDSKPFCAGTHIWNFADFLTPQHFRRVVLNRKGVFTRARQPKSAAFSVRGWWKAHSRLHSDHRPSPGPGDFLIQDLSGGKGIKMPD